MYCELPRNAASSAPTSTSVGTVIDGSDSITRPSCCFSTWRAASTRPDASRWTDRVELLAVGERGESLAFVRRGDLVGVVVPTVATLVTPESWPAADQDEAHRARRVGEEELERQVAAERVPADDGGVDTGRVEQGGDVADRERRRVRRRVGRSSRCVRVRAWSHVITVCDSASGPTTLANISAEAREAVGEEQCAPSPRARAIS